MCRGISTRSLVDDLVKAMGMTGISKSQVSRLCAEIDERVHGFLERPIEGDWPYLWIDATYVKVREGGRIISVAVIIAIGANTQGRREVLGLKVGASEAEPFWTDFLRSLTRRGLRGVKLVISDAHEGLKAAMRKVISATWQAAACISCATCWCMRPKASAAWSPRSFAPSLPRPARKPLGRSGTWWPINFKSDSRSENSRRMPSRTCRPHGIFLREHHSKIYSTNPDRTAQRRDQTP